MLRSMNELTGYSLKATDGNAGTVKDFLFNDMTWTVQYLVVDTGAWLPGRRVLLNPSALEQPDWSHQAFPLNVSKEQVEEAPHVSDHEPVSTQYQDQLHAYYGWAVPPTAGPTFSPYVPMPDDLPETAAVLEAEDEPNLRSTTEITGYHIQAEDGEIGHIEDFIVDDHQWVIRYAVVDTRNWLPGKKVLVASEWIDGVRWRKSLIYVSLTQEQVRNAPEYDPTEPVNRSYEARLYDFYGRPQYWTG